MAIVCPRCGTAYDAALFTFDRTIRCECGASLDLAGGHTLTNESNSIRKGAAPMSLKIESPAFAANATIPKRYTADGEDVSPPLRWEGVPEGTKELALICDDPDAPTPEPWVHWVIYKLPHDARELPEALPTDSKLESPAGTLQGRTSFQSGNAVGYGGPAPPPGHGVHHYHFKLFALDTEVDLDPGVDKKTLIDAIEGRVLDETELIGTYQR